MLLSVFIPLRIFLVSVSFQFLRKGSVCSLLFTVILTPLLLLFQFLLAIFSIKYICTSLIVITLSMSSINNILLYDGPSESEPIVNTNESLVMDSIHITSMNDVKL